MNADTRNWIATMLAGLGGVVLGGYDAFFNHNGAFGSAGDITFILAGLGALGLKTAFDLGVQVPTPPKA